MLFLQTKFSWLAAPLLWLAGAIVLSAVWATHTPEWINAHFNNNGASPVEAATIGFFFLQIAFFWLLPPVRPGRHRNFWLADFSLITLFAISRELDWHKLLITTSNLPGATHGTPFKLKYLLNADNPLADRLIVAACFGLALALCGGTLLYFLRRLLRGLAKLHPVCWSVAFLGGAALLSQLFDRLPAELRHSCGIHLSPSQHALTTVFEEGQELLLPLFIILAVVQAHLIYARPPSEDAPLACFDNL